MVEPSYGTWFYKLYTKFQTINVVVKHGYMFPWTFSEFHHLQKDTNVVKWRNVKIVLKQFVIHSFVYSKLTFDFTFIYISLLLFVNLYQENYYYLNLLFGNLKPNWHPEYSFLIHETWSNSNLLLINTSIITLIKI